MKDYFYTITEVAEKCGVTYCNFIGQINSGRLPEPERKIGNQRVFTEAGSECLSCDF